MIDIIRNQQKNDLLPRIILKCVRRYWVEEKKKTYAHLIQKKWDSECELVSFCVWFDLFVRKNRQAGFCRNVLDFDCDNFGKLYR